MSETNARIQFSMASESEWTAVNPQLRQGELAVSLKPSGKIKLVIGASGGAAYKDSIVVWDEESAQKILSNTQTAASNAAASASAAGGSASAAANSASAAKSYESAAADSASKASKSAREAATYNAEAKAARDIAVSSVAQLRQITFDVGPDGNVMYHVYEYTD